MSARSTVNTVPARSRDVQLATWRRAIDVMPGGTDSNFRAWGEDTIYVDRGKGCTVWDLDGNEFIDLRMGYGPVILGHADDRVDDYVNERMRRGVSFSLTSEDEIRANELVQELTGWVEMSRLTVAGTEATMHAMRVARAFTGRNKIVKFEGQYHGVHDYALISVLPNNVADLGDAENPSRLACRRGHGHPRALQQRRAAPPPVRAGGARHRRDHRGARPGQRAGDHAPGRLPRGDAGAHPGVRDPADLRRGDDRLPAGEGRGGRALRDHARPRDIRQGDGERLPGSGVRRQARHHEPHAEERQPRRHVRGQPDRRGGGRADARDPARHGCARHG